MSFNIRLGVAKDGENHWDKRKDFVVETIQDTAPDILGTQETWNFQAEYLGKHLKGYAQYGKGREPGMKGERCEMFWKSNRWAVVKADSFMLSETPDKHGSKSWDSSLPRIASWVILRERTTGKEVFAINTHFDHRGGVARTESAKLIRKHATELAGDRPIVVTGDMNFGPTSDGYKALAAKPWVDTYRAAHPEPKPNEGTFSGFRGKTSGARIDYVFTHGFEVKAATIDRREREGRNPSDHFPVTADLKAVK